MPLQRPQTRRLRHRRHHPGAQITQRQIQDRRRQASASEMLENNVADVEAGAANLQQIENVNSTVSRRSWRSTFSRPTTSKRSRPSNAFHGRGRKRSERLFHAIFAEGGKGDRALPKWSSRPPTVPTNSNSSTRPAYQSKDRTIATKIYGAADVSYTSQASTRIVTKPTVSATCRSVWQNSP